MPSRPCFIHLGGEKSIFCSFVEKKETTAYTSTVLVCTALYSRLARIALANVKHLQLFSPKQLAVLAQSKLAVEFVANLM